MPTGPKSFATGLILTSISFSLGVLYSNWAYDYYTLWRADPTEEAFAKSLAHYQIWAQLPAFLYHVHHFVMAMGILGFVVKLFKPSESNKLFDGGSLFLFMIGIAIYLTNLRQGAWSAVSGQWGDVSESTGINVIAASQVMIVFTLLGVIGLQLGQYYAEAEDEKAQAKLLLEEEQAKKDK